jgi:hypothetical protein
VRFERAIFAMLHSAVRYFCLDCYQAVAVLLPAVGSIYYKYSGYRRGV